VPPSKHIHPVSPFRHHHHPVPSQYGKRRPYIAAAIPKLNNTLFSKYALTKYMLLYVLRLLLEKDTPVGIDIINNPERYVAKKKSRETTLRCIDQVLNDVVTDLNAELDQVGDDFDYRGKLRDESWVKSIAHRLVADYIKLVSRNRIPSFSEEFKGAKGPAIKRKT
jgi:hypothetical protein